MANKQTIYLVLHLIYVLRYIINVIKYWGINKCFRIPLQHLHQKFHLPCWPLIKPFPQVSWDEILSFSFKSTALNYLKTVDTYFLLLYFYTIDKLYYEWNMVVWANVVRWQFITSFCGKSIPSLKQLTFRLLEHDLFVN